MKDHDIVYGQFMLCKSIGCEMNVKECLVSCDLDCIMTVVKPYYDKIYSEQSVSIQIPSYIVYYDS